MVNKSVHEEIVLKWILITVVVSARDLGSF